MNKRRSPNQKQTSTFNDYSYKPKYFHINQSPYSSKQQSTKEQVPKKQQFQTPKQAQMVTYINQVFIKAKAHQSSTKNLHVASTQALIKHNPEGFIKKKTWGKFELKDKKSTDKYLQYFDLRNQNLRGKPKNKFIKKLSDSGDSQISYNSNNSANSEGNAKFSFHNIAKNYLNKNRQISRNDYQTTVKLGNKQQKKQSNEPINMFIGTDSDPQTPQSSSKKKWFPQSSKKQFYPTSSHQTNHKIHNNNPNMTPRGFDNLEDFKTNIRTSVSPRAKQIYSYKNNFNNKIIQRKITPSKVSQKLFSSPPKKLQHAASEKDLLFHRKTISKTNMNLSKKDHSISFSKDKSQLFYEQNQRIQNSSHQNSLFNKRNRNSVDGQIGRRRALSKNQKNRLVLFTLNQDYPQFYEFLILKKIAQHKESVVVLCIQVNTKAIYCIKKCKAHQSNLEQLIMEHKVGNVCNHPNLVQTFGIFFDKQNFYILMQYMEGGTMLNRFNDKDKKSKRMNSINIRETITSFRKTTVMEKQHRNREILRQILEGVKYLHQNGIIHRDIKPENIYMAHNNYKIGDFGSSSFFNTFDYVGTLDYAAPQIMLKQKYTQTIDIWSIGCIAYQLEVGKPPFYHIDRNETIRRIVNVQYDISAITDKNLKDLISQMIIRKGNKRITALVALKHHYFCQLPTTRNRI